MNDDYFKDISKIIEENKWIEQFISAQGYCIVCGHNDPLDLELHHIAGRKNNPTTVSLCRNCHGRISRRQRHWPEIWTNDNNPINICDAIFLRGISDIFRLISDKYLERVLDG